MYIEFELDVCSIEISTNVSIETNKPNKLTSETDESAEIKNTKQTKRSYEKNEYARQSSGNR